MQFARTHAIAFAILASTLFANTATASNDLPSNGDENQTTVLQNGTIHSMSSQGTFVGSIVITDNKIVAVGEKVEVPQGAKTIDLKGCHIVPGLIESRGKLWLTKAATGEASKTASLNVIDAIDPWSKDWQELASQGITTVYVQPGSNSTLGGYGAVLNVGPLDSPEKIILKKESAVQAAIGITAPTSKDRFAQIAALKKLLESTKARIEKDKKKAEADKKTEAEKKEDVEKKTDKDKDATPDDEKSKADAANKKAAASKTPEEESTTQKVLKRVLNKEIPLNVEVHHSDAARQVLKLAKQFEIRVVLDGLSNVGSCAEAIAAAGYPIVVGPLFESSGTPVYRKNANYEWLSDASASSQLWALSSFSNSALPSRMLRMQAGMAVRIGVDPDAALAAMTYNSARILGVSNQVGTLEVGKLANIAVFAGDPLDASSRTRLVIVQGQTIFKSEAKPTTDSSAVAVALPNRLPGRYAIKTTRLLKDGEFSAATLLIEDGKILSVGDFEESTDTPVFDLKNTVITPGLVIGHTSLGQSAAIADSMESDASHLRSVDAIDPTTREVQKVLAGGFIHAGLSPGSTNTSSGTVGQLRLGADDYVANAMIANQFVLSKAARRADRFPSSLNGQVQMVNDLFNGQALPSSTYVSAAVGRSIAQEKLANIKFVVDGKRKAIIAAESKLEIRSALKLAKDNNIQPTLLSSGRVGDFAEKLAVQKFGLIVTAADGSEYDSHFKQIIAANEAGVPLAFGGDSPARIRATAALLVNAGLSRKAALLGITEGGAKVVGMSDISLSAGSLADLVVWSDNPLSLTAKPLSIVVDGQSVSTK